ncbi:MAG: AAA family ATPase [Candidatus Omnitrophica bacterium]|nr:AAA family ATPase [Candidatus Omnitrophota bacterium]
MFWKKLRLFWWNHWIKIVIAGWVIFIFWIPIAALSSIDSYQRSYMVAWLSTMGLQATISAVIFVVLYAWVLQGGLQKLKKKQVRSEGVDIHWNDVIGMEGAKLEARELVELIRDRARIKKIGGSIIRGMLMMGPPGCGKTYLAKAVATEAGIPFISMSGSEFVEVFVGVGASRVRQLFQKARRLAYGQGGCIVFIDEIDAIGRKRVFSVFGGTEETNSTQNQLLAEMDGLKDKDENVIVIGATNAPEDALDEALRRPGRFDRKIYVERPDLQEREDLFRYYLSKVKYDPNLDIARFARKAVRKSPADIANMTKEAALIATRVKKDVVDADHLSEAMERIDLGLKKHQKVSERERRITAYHETGHLIVTYLLHPTDDVFKASIIPRGPAGGVTYSLPIEDEMFSNRDWFLAEIRVLVAGYVAEKLKFAVTSSGVSSDFQHAMRLAHNMVWRLGMGRSESLGDYTSIPPDQLSENLKEKLNVETHEIIQSCMKDVEDLLKRENVIFERFAQELLEKQELDYDDIEVIFKEYGKSNPRVTAKYVPKTEQAQEARS